MYVSRNTENLMKYRFYLIYNCVLLHLQNYTTQNTDTFYYEDVAQWFIIFVSRTCAILKTRLCRSFMNLKRFHIKNSKYKSTNKIVFEYILYTRMTFSLIVVEYFEKKINKKNLILKTKCNLVFCHQIVVFYGFFFLSRT